MNLKTRSFVFGNDEEIKLMNLCETSVYRQGNIRSCQKRGDCLDYLEAL